MKGPRYDDGSGEESAEDDDEDSLTSDAADCREVHDRWVCELLQTFRAADAAGTGRLSREDFAKATRQLG